VIAEGMEVDAARMRRNLDLTQGLVLAEAVSIVLAQRLGRDRAHHLLEQCCHARWPSSATCVPCWVTSRRSAPSCLPTNSIACSTLPITSARPVWVARAVAEHQRFIA
jgi:3-carboxy-cis,cis-muconate cycloisomerase